ncbi:hypothetical protein MUP77_20420 [Candidatus Bathyarchaeota archaeon]|nr:hypothetical protein [Candidatus Bathyarchaeota archaeon]
MIRRDVVSKNVAFALGILSIVLAVSLAGALLNYTAMVPTLDDRIKSDTTLLERQAKLQTWLQGNVTALNQLEAWLTNNQSELGSIDAWLNSNMTMLSQTQEWLNSNMTMLSQTQEWLNSNMTMLSQTQEWLNSNMTAYQDYQSTHSYTNSQYNTLVNLSNQTTFDTNRVVNVNAWGSQTLIYSTPYAGYIVINFTSTGSNTYFQVGSSFINAYYSTTNTASSGTYTIPVFPGQTWLNVVQQGGLFGIVVIVTITYFY